MERIGLKKLLLQIKNIDFKGAFYRFCKSDNPLKYVLFPFGGLLLINGIPLIIGVSLFPIYPVLGSFFFTLSTIAGIVITFISIILFFPLSYAFKPIIYLETHFLDSWEFYTENFKCYYCVSELICGFIMISFFSSLLYLLWDLKRGKVNFKGNIFKIAKEKKTNLIIKVSLWFLWIVDCTKQFIKIPLKKSLLIFLLPCVAYIVIGDDKYEELCNVIYKIPRYGINSTAHDLKTLIEKKVSALYSKQLNSTFNEPLERLSSKFGDLNQYITKEEWENFKCPLPSGLDLLGSEHIVSDRYKPNLFIPRHNYLAFGHDFRGVPYKKDGKMFYDEKRHICKYDKNGILEEGDAQAMWKGNYKCPKYRDYISRSECIEKTIFDEFPKNMNVYFSDTIYLGMYDELIKDLDGKIFNIIVEIVKYPCDFLNEKGEIYYDGFECYKSLKKRKFKYVEFYIYGKNSEIVDKIKIKRADIVKRKRAEK
jgi:hypothetical protein